MGGADDRRLYDEIVGEQQARLERLAEHRGVARLRRVYDESQAEVMAKLKRLARVGRGATMDAHLKRAVLAQLIHGQRFVADQLGDELAAAADDGQRDQLRALARDLNRLERRFSGAAPVLPIDDVAHFQGIITGQRASMLRRHDASLQRYGTTIITKVEDELSKSLLQGESQSEAIDRVQDAVDGQWWRGERIVRCLPGDALVTGGVVGAVYRRWFEGNLVEVVTKRGRKLSATANHPMLTGRGWVLQGSIVPGDDLVCDARHQHLGPSGHQHVARGPTPIGEIFDACSAVGVRGRRRGRQPDFHGDRVHGEVDIARPDRMLMYGVFSELAKPACKQLFSLADKHSCGELFCARCLRLLPHERACLCQIADPDARFFEATQYHAVVDAVRRGDLRTALAGGVAAFNFVDRQVQLVCRSTIAGDSYPSRFGLGANLYASGSQHFPNHGRGTIQLQSDVPRADSSEIELDRVVDVRLRSFSSHVFNISTPNGYFAANGIFTGNTELAWASNASQAAGLASARKVVPDLMMQWRELVSDDGAPLDDRVGIDSLALHGQVVVPGEMFRTPARDPEGEAVSESLAYEEIAHPPNRPHDRATIAPWRSGWSIPAWRWGDDRRIPMR